MQGEHRKVLAVRIIDKIAEICNIMLGEFANVIFFSYLCASLRKEERTGKQKLSQYMKDYQLTSDGLYAYEYPRASVTADAVLFAEKDGQMHVLLIQRGNDPYKGYWAFPGGFLNMDETVALCAERELQEETGIVLTGMQLVGIYSDVERDPRGRVITAAYTAMTSMPEAYAGDDAAAARWWPLSALPELAFDHKLILSDAKRVLGIE